MENREILIAAVLILIAVMFRTLWHVGPNFELVTAVSIVAGYTLKNIKLAMMVPLVTMMISDSILGNSIIFLFTWSAYLFAPVMTKLAKRYFNDKNSAIRKIMFAEGSAILFVIVFFLWTNLGVVIVSNIYSKDLMGVLASYVNGLPFIKPQLISAIVMTPMILGFVAVLKNTLGNISISTNNQVLENKKFQ